VRDRANKVQVYGDKISGNCLKVKYVADYLQLEYSWVDVDITTGGSRTKEFLALSPQGQVPIVVLDNGKVLGQSNAIIRYLAHNTSLLPNDPFAAAKVDEALFWEQYSHEPYIAVCRFQMVYESRGAAERDQWRVARGEAALDYMDSHLNSREYWCDSGPSVADVALLAYTRLAHEGGFDLSNRHNVTRWITAAEQTLGLA